MKKLVCLAAAAAAIFLSGCYGPGGPATRAGRSVDNAAYHVGQGVEATGNAIENAATGD